MILSEGTSIIEYRNGKREILATAVNASTAKYLAMTANYYEGQEAEPIKQENANNKD